MLRTGAGWQRTADSIVVLAGTCVAALPFRDTPEETRGTTTATAPPLPVAGYLERTAAGGVFPRAVETPRRAYLWEQLVGFYGDRDRRPAWIVGRRPSDDALSLVGALGRASRHGLVSPDYGAERLRAARHPTI